jgi:hypothetical protein
MTNISGQRPDEIMILKKGGMQLYVSLLVFSTRLPLPESAYLSKIVNYIIFYQNVYKNNTYAII